MKQIMANLHNKILEGLIIALSVYLIIIGFDFIIDKQLIGIIPFWIGLALHDRFFELKKKKK